MKAKKILLSLMAIAAAVSMSAQVNEMKVRVNKPGAEIQPTMYGIFIEDINFAADGGLYAELVMNRSFEFPNNRLQGWNVGGRLEVMNDGPFERNPHYVRLYYIETAQRRVEQHYFSIRKRTLEYDDVMNKQREIVYGIRKNVLFDESSREFLFDTVADRVEGKIQEAIMLVDKNSKDKINKDVLLTWLNQTFPIGFDETVIVYKPDSLVDEEATAKNICDKIVNMYEIKASYEEPEAIAWLERQIILNAIDRLWQQHLNAMDQLRSSIGLRAYAQKDPLVEYKQEAYRMFDELMMAIDQDIMMNMFRSATSAAAFENMFANLPQQLMAMDDPMDALPVDENGMPVQAGEAPDEQPEIQITFRRDHEKIGRNDPCPCGSGKKFKKCCGK